MKSFFLFALALIAAIVTLNAIADSEIEQDNWSRSERKFIENNAVSASLSERASEYRLRVTVEKSSNTPSIKYDAITVQAYDNKGNELKVVKLDGAMSAYIEGRTGVTTATGFYVIPKNRNGEPDYTSIHWRGRNIILKLKAGK